MMRHFIRSCSVARFIDGSHVQIRTYRVDHHVFHIRSPFEMYLVNNSLLPWEIGILSMLLFVAGKDGLKQNYSLLSCRHAMK